MKLVSEPFDGTGFSNWKRSMTTTLSARNKLGFVDGSIPKPVLTSPNYKSWSRCNDMVISWLLGALSKTIGRSFIYSNSAHEIWLELEERYGVSSGAQLFVCSCGCQRGASQKLSKFQQDQRFIQFLMGLNESFNVIRGSTLMRSPLPSIDQVYSLLLQEETQREIHSTGHFLPDSASLNASRPHNSGNYNHLRNAGKRFQSDAMKLICTSGLSGLTPDFCTQLMQLLKSAQPSFDAAISSANFAGTISTLSSVACFSNFHTFSWILDSGASDHMCSQKQLFYSLTPLSQPITIYMPNGQIINIAFIGTVSVTHEIGHSLRKPLEIGNSQRGLYMLQSSFPYSIDDSSSSNASFITRHPSAIFLAPVENQFHCSVQKVRTYNALELGLSRDVTQFFLSKAHFMPLPVADIDTSLSYIIQHYDVHNSADSFQHESPTNYSIVCFCTITSSCTPLHNLKNISSCNSSIVLRPSYTLPPSEPESYSEAIKYPERKQTIEAEFSALEANKTWTHVKLPPSKKPTSCKWVFKVKKNSDGTIERYKARLVVRGYTKKEGVDYTEIFSPVVKMTTIRCLVATAVKKGWTMSHLDVNNAFLHGDLHEDVYMTPPPVYVDDILVVKNDHNEITTIKAYLDDVFNIKDLDKLHYFLGLEFAEFPTGMIVSQRKFTMDLLSEFDCVQSTHVITPLYPAVKLLPDQGVLLLNSSDYRRLIGKLNFLTNTRPYLSFCVQHLSQFMSAPRQPHWDAALHVLIYLCHNLSQGLLFTKDTSFQLEVLCDADWAACPNTRKYVSGFVVMMGGSLIS
ncbi:uncharacterized protein LOC141713822 [Apium graveolens]|uniref:uncharacterized protein LOC141713822 n=1 Tax=Apium graveolens TaxID=4045 RepID=UPI003D7A7651